jgi:hypothetical protein
MNKLIAALYLGLISSCAAAGSSEYTLYRSGVDTPTQKHDESLRIHVATFDARPFNSTEESAKYNLANCEFAQELFSANQPHYRGNMYSAIKIKYWCEQGRFKK